MQLEPESISKIRNRDYVLAALVPRMIKIVGDNGSALHGFGGRSVQLTDEIVLSASPLGADRVMLSVYYGLGDDIVKVFSAHVTGSPERGDPSFFRYMGGGVGILSWRRGTWEDVIMADPAPDGSSVIQVATNPD
jgi:hypothetical protein